MIGENLLEGQRRQTLSCTPSGCNSGSRCVADSSCNCSCTWENQGCGVNGCALNEMSQLATNCNFPDDCNGKTQCVKIAACASSCEVTLPSSPFNVGIDKSKILNSQVNPTHAYVDRVNFSITQSDPAGAIAVNPTSIDTNSEPNTPTNYNTAIQGNSLGIATVRADVTLYPEGTCFGTVDIVVRPTAWIQTQGGDVYTGGSLSNEIPETADDRNFSLKQEDDGFPGVIIHQGEVNLGEFGFSSNDSPNNWVAESKYEGKPFGSFQFFKKKFALQMQEPNFVSGSDAPGSDGVYYANGSVTIGNWNLGEDRWIVLLVENGDVTIDGDIIVPIGSFLAIATTGDINFDGEVGRAQGMFVADGRIDTGLNPQASLRIKRIFGKLLDEGKVLFNRLFQSEILARDPGDMGGSDLPEEALFAGEGVFVADGFDLSRDFGDDRNDDWPSETFMARPDFIMSSYNGPDQNLWWFFQQWQEMAP